MYFHRSELRTVRTGGGGTSKHPVVRSQTCLEVDELVAMTEGTLAPERRETVIAHVDRCARCGHVISHLGMLDMPARKVGRYQIERMLGVGGMGIVYAAFDPQLQRRVAIKLVRPENANPEAQALLLAEARALGRICHPNVVTVYDAGEHEGEVYITTELVDGLTLAEWQAEPRTVEEIVGVWIQVARGLAAAHAEHVVHGDVKPSNVFIGRDGRIRIGDFGLAHSGALPPHTDRIVIAGTPAYMAPEHRRGSPSARSDQYSACVAITEALTGRRPGAGAQVAVEPRALAAVLVRGLRADARERFAKMTELADALAAALASRPRRRRPAVLALATSAIIAAVTLGAALAVGL